MATTKHTRSPQSWRERLHVRLMQAEAVLLLAAGQTYVAKLVMDGTTWPNIAKVLFVMALAVGLFGFVLNRLCALLEGTVRGAHTAVETLPIPLAWLLLHLVALAGLACLEAWLWQKWPLW